MYTLATPTEIRCLFSCVTGKLDPRYYLQGVFIDATDTTTHVVATNGHALAELDHGEDHNPELADAVATWRALTGQPSLIIKPWKLATGRDGKQDVMLAFDGAHVFAHQGGTQTLLETIDAKYPTWQRVSQAHKTTSEPIEALGINPVYLAPFATKDTDGGIKLTFPSGVDSAVRVECTGSLRRITGTVMPIRTR